MEASSPSFHPCLNPKFDFVCLIARHNWFFDQSHSANVGSLFTTPRLYHSTQYATHLSVRVLDGEEESRRKKIIL
ncbi:hypothetical protein L1887_33989 [Cichorium endivia]|nr:hypothetical protein L1887_33989 [Cichorium endivia]